MLSTAGMLAAKLRDTSRSSVASNFAIHEASNAVFLKMMKYQRLVVRNQVLYPC
jgi:hypothetical protein